MAEIRFEKQTWIRADPAAVYAELSEPRNHIGLHPLIVRVDEVERGKGPDGAEYRVYDAVELLQLLGGLRWRNHIRVRIDLLEPGTVIDFSARSAPGIRIHSLYRLSECDGGTRVHQDFQAHVPALARRLVARIAERAQDALLTNLKLRLESPPGSP